MFGLPDAWDVYGGGNIGFSVALNSNYSSDLDFGSQIGGHWFWSEKWEYPSKLEEANLVELHMALALQCYYNIQYKKLKRFI